MGIIAIIIIAVIVGVVVSNSHKKTSGAAKSGSSSSGPSNVPQTDPNDPSTFVKDARLKQSFYGIAYTPENSLLPGCGNSLSECP